MRGPFVAAWLLMSFVASSSAWAAASDSYQAGISAFKAARYEEALGDFTTARDAGMKTATLHYNLGSTYYKLGRYRLAIDEFSRITQDPTWGALAEYNLGLITSKMGDENRARRHFRAAKRQANTDKLRRLADARLAAGEHPGVARPTESQWINYLALSSGFDDNVVLADGAYLSGASRKDDYFAEVSGFAGRYVSGDSSNGWRLDLGGGYRRYNELNDYDFGKSSLGLTYNRLVGAWYLQGSVVGDIQFAGGNHYTSAGTLRMLAYRRLGTLGVRLTNDFSLIRGASRYDYLSGTRDRSTIALMGRVSEARWRAGYSFEINDRDDIALGNEFFSYSPTRHGLFGRLEIPFNQRLIGETRANFRISRYADENVEMTANNTLIQKSRDAERLSIALRLTYRVSGRWQLFGEYQYSDNRSDIDRYSYESAQYAIGIDTAL